MGLSAAPLVVIADDDADLLAMLEFRLNEWGYAVRCAANRSQLREVLAETAADLLLLDLQFGQERGLDVLSDLLRERFSAPVIILTAHGTIESAVQAIKLGAQNYLTKPPDLPQLQIMVQQAVEHHRCKHQLHSVEELFEDHGNTAHRPMLGNSPKMQALREMIADAAPTNATVLILGESGTGKELVARAIHDLSQRTKGMFVPVNMAAVPANLAEALLFGHEKGSFTGADAQQQGWCELADNGTLFLDELGEMEVSLQAKMLRFLQERQIQRVGSNRGLSVDVRIVAATNQDPLKLIREGRLREDLYYRLNVLPIECPPLRERREDIPLLATYFMRRAAKAWGKRITAISPDVMTALQRYDWPGNVRELDNLLQRMVILCRGSHILAEQLPAEFLILPSSSETQIADEPVIADGLKPMARMEKQAIQDALDSCEGNVVQAAQVLGIGQATIYRKIKRYGISLRRHSYRFEQTSD
jgi:DNA-binding NtrC family response regulator